jgi:large subunit ribosomal protein L41
MPLLSDYTHVNPVGYTDPVTKKFVRVKEMVSEMIVPDLDGFELKPYVSFRTDVEIEKK